ncbi:MAG TPA: NYN domain-containing protein, partial [Propionibacteriaceae bacterium]|nr:NYN domain-containing protein [Propionibacteriaceae bacterium]
FGTLVLTRAYADWSQPVNADYRGQLVGRAVDLVQLFPAAAYGKNGADIRLAVDAVEDMFRLPDLTHVVIVAGDSDYIPLAQRAKRLGKYVVAVGVAGSTSRSLAAACDRMLSYDRLAGVEPAETEDVTQEVQPSQVEEPQDVQPPAPARRRRAASTPATPTETEAPQNVDAAAVPEPEPTAGKDNKGTKRSDAQTQQRAAAGQLLQRALRLGHDKDDDAEWLDSSSVKNQLLRMDPAFNEKELGYASFSDFASSFKFVELDTTQQVRRIRLRRR